MLFLYQAKPFYLLLVLSPVIGFYVVLPSGVLYFIVALVLLYAFYYFHFIIEEKFNTALCQLFHQCKLVSLLDRTTPFCAVLGVLLTPPHKPML